MNMCDSHAFMFDRKKMRPLKVQNAHNNMTLSHNIFITIDATSVRV